MENSILNPFTLSGTSPPAITKKFDIEVITRNLIETLYRQSRPCAEKILMKLVRGRKQLKVAALRILIKDGTVDRSGLGKKGNPYLYSLKEVPQTRQDNSVVEEIII